MLIDLHANPGDLSPEEFVEAVKASGLDAVVVTSTNTVDRLGAYLDALDDAEILAFGGVELTLDKGAIVLVPRDADADEFADANWGGARPWDIEDLQERLETFEGAVIAAHPYCRDLPSCLGDRIYRIKQALAVETRVGRGEAAWDNMADQVAAKRGIAPIASSSGDVAYLGAAATVMPDDIEDEAGLVDALEAGLTLPVELDDPNAMRDRRPPRREPREDRDDRRGRGRRDDRGRGRRDDRGRGRGRDRGRR